MNYKTNNVLVQTFGVNGLNGLTNKLRLNLAKIGLVLVILLGGLHPASAFYDPGLQRWIERDPMGDIEGAAYIGALETPKIDYPNLLERTVKVKDENDSLSDSIALGDWSQANGNLFGGIANDPLNKADPFGLDANSYAACIEKYRNPITEQLPNAIAESLNKKGSGNGKGPHVPGWVPPAAHGANALGNLAVGSTGRVGIAGVPPHPTTWQHKLLGKWGGKFLGRAAIVLTVAEGFWDLGLLGGCGIAEAID